MAVVSSSASSVFSGMTEVAASGPLSSLTSSGYLATDVAAPSCRLVSAVEPSSNTLHSVRHQGVSSTTCARLATTKLMRVWSSSSSAISISSMLAPSSSSGCCSTIYSTYLSSNSFISACWHPSNSLLRSLVRTLPLKTVASTSGRKRLDAAVPVT